MFKNIRKSSFLVAFLLLSFLVKSQHLNFHHFSKEDGYIDQTDFEIQIEQDRSGFIWIPTLNGLYRYDGQEFRLFQYEPDNPNGLSTNIIRVVFEDSAGKLWIGTGNGIHIYDPETGLFEHLVHDPNDPKSLCGNDVRSIGEDKEGNIWVGVVVHIACVCNKEERKFRKTFQPAGDVGFLQQENGTIWLTGGLGLFKYAPEQDRLIHFQHPAVHGETSDEDLRAYGVVNLFETPKGKIWGTSKRHWKGEFDPVNNTFHEFPKIIENASRAFSSETIFQDRNDLVWFGGVYSVSKYDPYHDTYQIFKHQPEDITSCQPGDITSIFQDRAGSIWFSSYQNDGLSVVYSPQNPFEVLDIPSCDMLLMLDDRYLLTVSNQGDKWVFDTETSKIIPYSLPPSFEQSKVDWMKLGPDNSLWWIVFSGANSRTHAQGVDLGNGERLSTPWSDLFTFDRQANLWFRDPKYFDRNTGELVDYANKIAAIDPSEQRKKSVYYQSLVDRKGRTWLGTNLGGLTRYDRTNDEVKFYKPKSNDPNAVVSGSVNMLFESTNGWIYILTANGMSVYQDESDRFVRLGVSQGGSQRVQVEVAEDNNQNIWLGLSDELVRIDAKDFNIQKFGESDGLPAGVYGESFAKDKQGRIYFIKNHKVYRFEPNQLHPDTTAYPIVLTDFFLNHKRTPPNSEGAPIQKVIQYVDQLELDYTQSDFGFRFISPDFKKGDQLEYYYLLENYSKDWVNIGNDNEVHFTNISQGKYRFKVKAKTPAGTWTSEHEGLAITVKPAWWETWWFYLLIILSIAALIFTWIYRLRTAVNKATKKIREDKAIIERQAEKLKELDQAKSQFFTNISHEFRTPLTIISGVVDNMKLKPAVWGEKGLTIIKQNSLNLLNLINQILDLRKLESKKLKLNLMQGDIIEYLNYLQESYKSYAENEGLQLHFIPPVDKVIMDYDPDKILRIVSNLLSNAIKYNQAGGNIYFQIEKTMHGTETESLIIRVKDTGKGIPEEKLNNIFERFYQINEPGEEKIVGSGIGLALTYELIQLMGGEINVESEIGLGTSFTVVLPITHSSEMNKTIESEVLSELNEELTAGIQSELKPTLSRQSNTSNNLPHLLIVEDNPQIVQILIAGLEDHYQLEIANNGQAGIDKAIENIPDIIISDVMMPEKNGYELTETLKTDARTEHIPIILLTAKSDQDAKVAGLERGADAFLAKPFEQKELLVRLKNLLELRKKLQARYANVSVTSKTKQEGTSTDHPFLQQFYSLIEKEISNPNLDMNQICRSLGMSRSQVFRKLKALTGKPATILIRSYRLQKGKELLAQGDLSVSEVAFDVGFTSLSYFSRAFQEEFGIPPSATRK